MVGTAVIKERASYPNRPLAFSHKYALEFSDPLYDAFEGLPDIFRVNLGRERRRHAHTICLRARIT